MIVCVIISLAEYITLNEERNDYTSSGEYTGIGFKNVDGKEQEMSRFLKLLLEQSDNSDDSYDVCLGLQVESPAWDAIYDSFSPSIYFLYEDDTCFVNGYDNFSSSICFLEEFQEFDEFFYLLNVLFGKTYVYRTDGNWSTVVDNYYREETIYDPCKCKVFDGTYFVCYGDNTALGENIWNIAKKEIERKAKKQGIMPEWSVEEDGTIEPDGSDFYDFCYDELYDNDLYEKYGTEKSKKNIEMREPSKEFVDEIVARAKETNNTELLAILSEKFEID